MIHPPAALAFDLDGTLIDSRRDLATAVNRVRSSYRLEPLALAAVLSMVGEGARNLVARALDLDPSSADTARLDEALGRFFRHYEAVCLDTTRPYPGILEALDALARSFPLALCTNKPERFTRVLIDRLGLARFLPHVVAGDTLPTRKPDPAGMRLLAARMLAPLAEVMLIGDSRVDAQTAAAAGCRFALVTWGFAGAGEEAGLSAACRPEIVAADAQGLLRALRAEVGG